MTDKPHVHDILDTEASDLSDPSLQTAMRLVRKGKEMVLSLKSDPASRSAAEVRGLVEAANRAMIDWLATGNDAAIELYSVELFRALTGPGITKENAYPLENLDRSAALVARLKAVFEIGATFRQEPFDYARFVSILSGRRYRKHRAVLLYVFVEGGDVCPADLLGVEGRPKDGPLTEEGLFPWEYVPEKRPRANEALDRLHSFHLVHKRIEGGSAFYRISGVGRRVTKMLFPGSEIEHYRMLAVASRQPHAVTASSSGGWARAALGGAPESTYLLDEWVRRNEHQGLDGLKDETTRARAQELYALRARHSRISHWIDNDRLRTLSNPKVKVGVGDFADGRLLKCAIEHASLEDVEVEVLAWDKLLDAAASGRAEIVFSNLAMLASRKDRDRFDYDSPGLALYKGFALLTREHWLQGEIGPYSSEEEVLRWFARSGGFTIASGGTDHAFAIETVALRHGLDIVRTSLDRVGDLTDPDTIGLVTSYDPTEGFRIFMNGPQPGGEADWSVPVGYVGGLTQRWAAERESKQEEERAVIELLTDSEPSSGLNRALALSQENMLVWARSLSKSDLMPVGAERRKALRRGVSEISRAWYEGVGRINRVLSGNGDDTDEAFAAKLVDEINLIYRGPEYPEIDEFTRDELGLWWNQQEILFCSEEEAYDSIIEALKARLRYSEDLAPGMIEEDPVPLEEPYDLHEPDLAEVTT